MQSEERQVDKVDRKSKNKIKTLTLYMILSGKNSN